MKITWPMNKRIAVMVAFDLDADFLWTQRGDGNKDHFANLSRGRYDVKQALPRILNMLDRQEIKTTFFVPGAVAEQYPEAVKEIAHRGHEISYHGYYHEDDDNASYEEEHQTMLRCEKLFKTLTEQQLMGHRGPEGIVHDYTIKLLLEHGYIYSSNWRHSDGPYIHTLDEKEVPVVELPKDSIFDDTAFDFFTDTYPERHELKSAREMKEIWTDEFDALAEEGRMMNFVLHPQFMGRASRVAMLEDLIRYMKKFGAWIATNKEVAEYILEQKGLRKK